MGPSQGQNFGPILGAKMALLKLLCTMDFPTIYFQLFIHTISIARILNKLVPELFI